MLIFNFVFLGITLLQSYSSKCSLFYSKQFHKITIQFIKMFPYIAFIPLVTYEMIILQNGSPANKIISILNVMFFAIWS